MEKSRLCKKKVKQAGLSKEQCKQSVNLPYHIRGKITERWLVETEGIFS